MVPQPDPTLVRGSNELRPLRLLRVVVGVAFRRPGPNESDGIGRNGLGFAARLRHVLIVEGDPIVGLAATGLAGLYGVIRKAFFRCWIGEKRGKQMTQLTQLNQRAYEPYLWVCTCRRPGQTAPRTAQWH